MNGLLEKARKLAASLESPSPVARIKPKRPQGQFTGTHAFPLPAEHDPPRSQPDGEAKTTPVNCFTCHGSDFWRRDVRYADGTKALGPWVCRTCHPPASGADRASGQDGL